MRTIQTLLILILCIPINLFSQLEGQARIDSLKSELPNAKQDTNHVLLLAHLSQDLRNIDSDEAIEYGQKCLKLAKEIKYAFGEAAAYNSMANTFGFTRSDYDKALEYYNSAMDINIKNDDKYGVSTCLSNMALIYEMKSNYKKALEMYEMSEEISLELNDKYSLAINYGNRGIVYTSLSNYSLSLEYYFKSLKMYEEIQMYLGQAATLGNIGLLYKSQFDNENANKYYLKALEINKKIDNQLGMADNYASLGEILKEKGEFEEAIIYFNKALLINKDFGRLFNHAGVLRLLGVLYSDIEEYSLAMDHFQRALKINQELNVLSSIANDLGAIGRLYLWLSDVSVLSDHNITNQLLSKDVNVNLNRAIKNLKEAISIFEETGELHSRADAYKDLADAYKLKGDHKSSDEFIRKHMLFKDSVFNQDKAKEIGKLEAERDQIIKEREEEEIARKLDAEIQRRNQLQYSAISIFTLIFFAFLYYLTRKNISFGTIDTVTFLGFLLLYEFLLVLLEPWIEELTDEIPIYMLLINIALALVLIPLQRIEKRIKLRIESKNNS